MPEPDLHDVLQVPAAEACEVVQTFPFELSDEALAKSVRLRRFRRDAEAFNAFCFPKPGEPSGILSVAIMDEKTRLDAYLIEPQGGVPRLLHDPIAVGRKGRRRGESLARTQVDEDQNAGMKLPAQRVDGLAEEVARDQRLHVGVHEGRPFNRRPLRGLRRERMNPLVLQDSLDRRPPHAASDLLEFADDPLVAPQSVRPSHLADDLSDAFWDARALCQIIRTLPTLPQSYNRDRP